MTTTTHAPTRVVTIEDDPRYRSSLEALLRVAAGFQLMRAFPTPADALAAAETEASNWDLVLMDLELPGMTGVECTRRMKALRPEITVVVLTVFEERVMIVDAICAGADGYLLKRTPAEDLLAQLRSVVAGGSPLSAGVAKSVLELVRQVNHGVLKTTSAAPDSIELTTRELEVLALLVQGTSYKGVASALGISIDTVRTYIRAIYRKLQVHSVGEAVGRAVREGLV